MLAMTYSTFMVNPQPTTSCRDLATLPHLFLSSRLADILNRTEPSELAVKLAVIPPLAVTPSMLYGAAYQARADGDEGRLIHGDWSAYFNGTLHFKRLGDH